MTTMTNMLREQIHIEIAFNNANNMGTQVYTWYVQLVNAIWITQPLTSAQRRNNKH